MSVNAASSALAAALLLVATAAHAQSVDLSKMKCKDLIELPKETIASLTIWLDGYLTDDEEPRVVDLALIRVKAEKLGLYCAQNPKVGIISAAEEVMDK
jgi:acid stress chaperone HdeB